VTTSELDMQGAHSPPRPPARPRLAGWQRRWAGTAIFVAFAIMLFFVYLAQARTVPVISDGASSALQAWDMLHGNVLLRGWSLTDVSFYTTELPEYMLVELVRGLNTDVVHVAAALTYTLIVALAALLAKGRATGREGLVRLLIPVGIMLAPSLGLASAALLSNPDHFGTSVPLLVIWLVLDRARSRWWVPAVVALVLAWAQVADTLVLYEGVLPLVVVCAVRMYRRRGPLAGQWYELSLAAGALASTAAATLAVALIRQAGGFAVRSPSTAFAAATAMPWHLSAVVRNALELLGADFFGLHLGPPAVIALIHLAGVVLVAWAGARAVRCFYGEDDLVVQVLAAALIAGLAAYVLGTRLGLNELAATLPVGAVLAGRLLAGRLIRLGMVPALGAVLVCYAVFLLNNAAQSLLNSALLPPAVSENQQAASWLEAHHLSYGLAGYWEANTITLASGNRIQVRAVRTIGDKIVVTHWNSRAPWYDARQHDARFVIWAPHHVCVTSCLSLASLRAVFGRPAATYRVGRYLVLVWHKNLLEGRIAFGPPIGPNTLAAR
jgi:hypothetical protein